MERAERYGLGVAAVGHVALFVALSLSLFSARVPKPPVADTMDVQLVDKVGLTSAAPKVAQEAPAPSVAPEQGPPTEAAPPPPAPAPKPEPKPSPPKPEPKPEVKPEPKPTPAKPEPKPAPEKPAKPAPQKQPPKKTGLSSDFLKDLPKDTPGKEKPKGSRLGSDFLKGLSADKSTGKANAPRAAAVSAQSMASLGAAIIAQVKRCYQYPSGGTDIQRIVTVLDLRMTRDGRVSLATAVDHEGISDTNRRYVSQMDDAAKRAVYQCAPLKLPPDLYDGGWEHIQIGFHPEALGG